MKREAAWNWAVGALCVVAVAWTLDTALSGAEFRQRRAALERDLAAVRRLENGEGPAAAWRAAAEREGRHAPDPAEALGAAAAVESRSEEPLGGGWTRRECTVRVMRADYADLAERLDILRDAGWRLRSGEWTPGPEAGRGGALLVLETLDFAAEKE